MLTNEQKRIFLFLFGCIGLRVAITYVAYKYQNLLPYMGIIAILISFGFTIIYLGGYRKTGAEVFGDKIWWNDLRPIHALLYLLFAIFALTPSLNSHAWKFLAIDVTIGLVAFIIYHTHKSR
jgi:hypothetical protein